MNGRKHLLVLCCIVSLSGCAALLGPTTDNAAKNLLTAEALLSNKEADPVKVERLIREAIDIYGKKNDQFGLAEAYRQYGLFFRSIAVSTAADHYRENGFLDKTVRFEDRYQKAIEHFAMSRDLLTDLGRYDSLSGVYVSLAKTYDLTNRRDEACDAFYKSLESYARFKMASQEIDEKRSEEIAVYIQYVDSMKQQAGCPDVPVVLPAEPVKPALKPVPTSPYAPPLEPASSEALSPAVQSSSSPTSAPAVP